MTEFSMGTDGKRHGGIAIGKCTKRDVSWNFLPDGRVPNKCRFSFSLSLSLPLHISVSISLSLSLTLSPSLTLSLSLYLSVVRSPTLDM